MLWIVPTTQIYDQTLRALKDRDHPYRQQLDVASAGRTLVLEKTSGFRPQDVDERLCVLLLMLPSANRETNAYFGGSGTPISAEVEHRFREVEHRFRDVEHPFRGKWNAGSGVVNARR